MLTPDRSATSPMRSADEFITKFYTLELGLESSRKSSVEGDTDTRRLLTSRRFDTAVVVGLGTILIETPFVLCETPSISSAVLDLSPPSPTGSLFASFAPAR